MNLQKQPKGKNQKLRDSPKRCPYCMGCGIENPNGDILCLAHSNRLQDGKGRGLKARDNTGAILCNNCHNYVDGRSAVATKEEMQNYHYKAHLGTMAWWIKEGYQ